MSITIHLYEPQAVPRQTSLVLEEPGPISVYALHDNLTEDTRDLRSTIVRRYDQHPPPHSTLLFDLDVRSARPGELPTMRVMKVGARAVIELIRADSRGRVTKGLDLKSGSRFEATLRDLRTLSYSLEIETELAAGKGAVSGSRPTGSKAVQSLGSLVWVVPNIVETIAAPAGKIVAAFTKWAKKMGLSPAMLSPLILMSAFMFGALYVAYEQYQSGMDAQERLEALELEMEDVKAAKNAAVDAEQSCREQRKDLTKKLDQIEEARKLQAEIALAVPLAHTVGIENGGNRMGSEAVMEFDGPASKSVHKLVVSGMASAQEPMNMALVCRSQESALGLDLPAYILTWHPNADLLCPEEYQEVMGGVDIGGPWGLSKRVSAEFGAIAEVEEGVDIRFNERWSANTLTTGLRVVMSTLLRADTGDRPPVTPSQVHLWSLALFDAYNRMPSPADGAMDRPAEECIAEVIDELAGRYVPAEPGQPVLPPLADVASGADVPITPTSGCPWPSGAIRSGAKSALRATTQLALIQQMEEDGEEGEGSDEG